MASANMADEPVINATMSLTMAIIKLAVRAVIITFFEDCPLFFISKYFTVFRFICQWIKLFFDDIMCCHRRIHK